MRKRFDPLGEELAALLRQRRTMQADDAADFRELARLDPGRASWLDIGQAYQALPGLAHSLQGRAPLLGVDAHRLNLPRKEGAVRNRHQVERVRRTSSATAGVCAADSGLHLLLLHRVHSSSCVPSVPDRLFVPILGWAGVFQANMGICRSPATQPGYTFAPGPPNHHSHSNYARTNAVHIDQLSTAELQSQLATLEQQYAKLKGLGLALDLTRGKPCTEQVALADGLDGILAG